MALSATSTLDSSKIGKARPRSSRWCRRVWAPTAGICGWTLARAHARSGDRVAIAAYLGHGDSFDRAILQFSQAYTEQNECDYKQLAAAAKSGRITAETGL
jgi:sugar/nucleoside kinase (ribokinase family)